METPARFTFSPDGNTKVFPIPVTMKGDNYVRIDIDGVILNDRSKFDLVNNAVVFVSLTDVPSGSQLDVLVVQTDEGISNLGNVNSVDLVASNITDVQTVAGNITSVNTTATNIAAVNTTATNIASVIDAVNQANAAAASAAAALVSENAAAASESAADASETAAAASAAASATSASNSASSASAALASENAAATSETNAAASAAASASSATSSANSATASAASAAAALVSENAAAASETAAAASEAAASTSEANAAASETAAAASETNAAASETAAATSAAAALVSETAAAASETAAAASEAAAAASEAAAATSETNAAASETAAAASEAAAATSETNAANSAAASATSATASATSASNAATSETNAATSAAAASASQIAAAASAASAANSYDLFDDRYLGTKASDPTLDNDGNALVAGALYFNSTANEMRVYDGGNWIAASSAGGASLLKYEFTATSGQTVFSGADDNGATLSYVQDNMVLFLNGVALDDVADYTATDGTSIVLTSGATAGDLLYIIAFKSFTTADMVAASTGGTFYNDIAIQGNLSVTGTIDGVDISGLASVATSGDYNDLINTPSPFDPNTLATVATTGAYSDLSGLPTLGTAAATASTDYATAAQGALADTAVQPNDSVTFTDTTVTGAFTSTGIDDNATSTAVTLDASGNVLVGKTADNWGTTGVQVHGYGVVAASRNGYVVNLNRETTDGDIARFQKDGTTVGSIGTNSSTFSGTVTAGAFVGDGSGLTGISPPTSVGAVGTYMFGYVSYTSDSAMSPGDTIAGSAIDYAGMRVSSNTGRYFLNTYTTTSPAGTWRIMGYYSGINSDWNWGASIFVRIA